MVACIRITLTALFYTLYYVENKILSVYVNTLICWFRIWIQSATKSLEIPIIMRKLSLDFEEATHKLKTWRFWRFFEKKKNSFLFFFFPKILSLLM